MLPQPDDRDLRLDLWPSPAPRDADFLLHRAPSSSIPPQTVAVASTAEEHSGSVRVGVRAVPARNAFELGLALPAARIDHAALGTRLRRVLRRDLDYLPAFRRDLVSQHLHETAPAAIEDCAIEAGLLAYPCTWLFGRSLRARGHASDVQSLDDHSAVVLGVAIRLAVQDGVALPARFPMQAGHDGPCILLVLGSLLSARNSALRARELFADTFERTRVWHTMTVRVGDQVDHSAVDGDDGFTTWKRVGLFELNGHTREPCVSITHKRACLCFAARRSVHNSRYGTELRKHHNTVATNAFNTK